MITKAELDFYERVPHELGRIADAITKLHGVLTDAPEKTETPVKEEHPIDSQFDVLAVTDVIMRCTYDNKTSFSCVKALVDVILNDQLQLRGLRILDGNRGPYVAYPPDLFDHDERELAYNPITRQLKEHIENCVLEKYMEITKEG